MNELSYAEMFLLVWALGATVLAVMFYVFFKRAVVAGAKMLFAFELLERGKTELFRDKDGNLRMREKENE